MIKLLIDFIQFLNSTVPLLTSLAIFTLLAAVLSKSIKKHETVYYIILAIPFVLIAVPFIGRLLGFEMFSFSRVPFLGTIIRDYIHFGTFAFPLLIIVMYVGALNPKIVWVKKLLNIRKELSIISGFPVFAHSLIRVANNFPNSLRFFTNNAEYMANTRVTSELGAGISNFSFVLGIVLLVLFIPLWVTSFDSVHKRMGSVKWKKLQKWSYLFYALLFVHAMGIQVGGMLNPRGGGRQAQAVVEVRADVATTSDVNYGNANGDTNAGAHHGGANNGTYSGETSEATDRRANGVTSGRPGGQDGAQVAEGHSRRGNRESGSQASERRSGRGNRGSDGRQATEGYGGNRGGRNTGEIAGSQSHGGDDAVQTAGGRGHREDVGPAEPGETGRGENRVTSSGRGGRAQSIGFSDIQVSPQAKRYIHIVSLILIFGSYLYLRLRKARKDAAKKIKIKRRA